MSTSLSPFRFRGDLLGDFRREFDTLMNRFFREEEGEAMAAWMPRVNLGETSENYVVTVDIPGMKPEEIDIELRHGDLWITGRREAEKEEEGQMWHRVERQRGEFRRVIRLGDDVDPEHVQAEYHAGVLKITVPKCAEARTQRITVKAT